VRAVVRPVLRTAFRMEVSGEENVPESGPAILAPNHDSMWDVPLLVVASPRRVVFMAHRDVFATAWKRWLMTELGGFPVSSGAGAIRSATEGTRVAQGLAEFKPGAARLALSLGVPLIPVAIAGTSQIMPRGSLLPRLPQLRLKFGTPIEVERVDDPGVRRRRVPELTSELRDRVEGLLR